MQLRRAFQTLPVGAISSAPGAVPVIVAILAGQSNINGRNADDGLTAPIADVYEFGGDAAHVASYQQLAAMNGPLHHPEALLRTGPDEQILADLKAANPDAKVVGVPCATGSTAMAGGTSPAWASSSTPGAGGTRFEFMVDQANAARAAILAAWPSATITTVFHFVQGEQDAVLAVSKATYQTALTNFIADSRSRVTGAGSAAFVIGSMLPQKWIVGSANYDAAYAAINEAHVAVSLAGTSVLYARGPDERAANDNLHYQPATVARDFGTRMVAILSDTVGPSVTTTLAQNSTQGDTLAIALTHDDPSGHATFHINGGADAAQFEISDPYVSPVLRWTGNGTGPAAGDYEVGVRARDGAGNYGATVTITVTVAAAGETSPASFFTTERGMVWDLSDTSTLFQDIAGTTPVTAAGQPVGYIEDQSGNNNHWIAAADNTTRPTYQVDADGKPYLQFDGSNDVLFANTPFVEDGNRVVTAIMGVYAAAQSATKTLLSCNSTASGTPFVVPFQTVNSPQDDLRIQARNDGSNSASIVPVLADVLDSTKRALTCIFRGTNATSSMRNAASRPAGGGSGGYSDGVVGSWAGTLTVTRCGLGANSGATPANFYSGRIYSGFVINRVLTDSEIKAGEDWVAARQLTSPLP